MSPVRRYALVGTGSRATMYLDAIADTYADSAQLVGLCDLSQTRMNWHNRRLNTRFGMAPAPAYDAADFDRMIAETRPDVVIVTTVDATHHTYICRALHLGCDVITEKPMTVDAEKAQQIFAAIDQTGHALRVAFNYRYAPAYTRLRQIMMDNVIGRPLSVDFSWLLDVHHGADYFRRWHREKHHSGGLLVHKATHHFDLINWWIGSYPRDVYAFGDLQFYGRQNAEQRGEHYPYARYTGVPEAADDPFGLFLDQDAALRGLYLEAEADSGYIRDRNVFGEPITIEDTMAVTARYRNGALLSYCLVAYSPWEGVRVAITGTQGRVELDVLESTSWLKGQDHAGDQVLKASTDVFKRAQLRVFPMFGQSYPVDIPQGEGGHGGADPVLLEQLFSPDPPPDPFGRAASHLDGAASVLVGIAANQSIATQQAIKLDSLMRLPDPATG